MTNRKFNVVPVKTSIVTADKIILIDSEDSNKLKQADATAFKGTQGDIGATGPAGANGTNGTNGTNGANGIDGVDGNGIVSVTLTSGTHAPGTLDTYTILYTDTTTSTFQVYNGVNGAGSGDVTSSSNITDNAIVRGDGGAKGVQTSGVIIDDNNNVYTNNYFANITSTVSAVGTTILTVASSKTQRLTGASTQTFQLPVGTTLPLSSIFEFDNNSSSSLIITNNAGTILYTVPAGGAVQSQCTGNVTSNGVWDFHAMTPSSVTWGSGVTGLVMNSVLSTSPSVGSGASSSTAPSFIPQRGASTTGFGGDGTSLYGIISGIGRLIVTSTGIGIRNVANTFTGSFTNTITANRTYTLPDKGGTLATTEEPDFYKYVISRTVDGSGNMTVTLLNYLGATPSASAPVKVQIGGVVYTITSALSVVLDPASYFNAGSSELATKEIELFTYLGFKASDSSIILGCSRIPYINFYSDSVNTFNNEKYLRTSASVASTDIFVNIGRFNCINSGTAGYTWSIPATSVIVNRPMNETRWLDGSSTLSAEGSMTVTNVVINHFKYKIVGDNLFYKNNIKMDFGGNTNNAFFETLPFGRSITESYDIAGVGFGYDNSDIAPSVIFESTNTNKLRIIKLSSVYAIVANAKIRIMGNYKI